MIRSISIRQQGRSFRAARMGALDPISAGVGLAVSGAQMWLQSINQSHAQMSGTTEIVNGWAQQMGNLTNAYLSEPNPTCADQRAALDAFDQAWLWLQSTAACGNGAFGAAGLACISDRAPGGKYDATRANRDPIANDPRMAGAGCDTGTQIFLPSLSTGTYQATNLTSSGGSAATGTAPDVTTNSAVSASAQVSTGIPAWGLVAVVAVGALFLFGGGSRS